MKLAAMSLGGSSSALLAKELPVSPGAVVLSREKEKLALQELNDRYMFCSVVNGNDNDYIMQMRFLSAWSRRLVEREEKTGSQRAQ